VVQVLVEHGLVLGGVMVVAVLLAAGQGFRHAHSQESERRRLMLSGWLGSLCAIGAACVFTFPLRIGALELLGALGLGIVLGLSPTSERDAEAGAGAWMRGGVFVVFGVAVVAILTPWALRDSEASVYGSADHARSRGTAALEVGGTNAGFEASSWYRLALRRDPLDRVSLQMLSRAQLEAGEIETAVEVLELAARVDPTLPWTWRDLARLQRRLGDYELSRASYQRMLWCDLPDDLRQEHVLEAMQGPGDPVAIAEAVLPDRGDVLVLGARQLEREGRRGAAELRFARAAELQPRYNAHLASFLLRQDRDAEALHAAEAAGEGCFALEVRATAHFKLGQLDAAGPMFSRALSECSDEAARNRRIRVGLARVRLEQGDPAGRENLEKLLEEDPSDVRLMRVLATWARQQKHRTLLTAQLERIVASGEARPREVREFDRLRVGLPLMEAMDRAQVDTRVELPGEEAPDTPKQ